MIRYIGTKRVKRRSDDVVGVAESFPQMWKSFRTVMLLDKFPINVLCRYTSLFETSLKGKKVYFRRAVDYPGFSIAVRSGYIPGNNVVLQELVPSPKYVLRPSVCDQALSV